MVVAHVPQWRQPALEPKGALLLLGGGLGWLLAVWRNRPLPAHPWALILPLGWLTLSSLWSPAPFLGLQRVLWFLAAMGLAAAWQGRGQVPSFMKGFLLGTACHAGLIFLQWIPAVRAVLPPTLGVDPFQGVGRGFFHNTNMAALPLVLAAAWVLLGDASRRGRAHLVWLMPALALTQSRLAMGTLATLVAWDTARTWARGGRGALLEHSLCIGTLLLAAAFGWAAHPWGWLLPLGGGIVGWLGRNEAATDLKEPRGEAILVVALCLGISAGTATRTMKNDHPAAQAGEAATTLDHASVSSSQRLSYYRAALLATLDRPLVGQGLGSARPLYPAYVDRDRPVRDIAYGDFQRPNNLHSEALELLLEGGIVVLLLALAGGWADRRGAGGKVRWDLAAPVLLMGCLDFPLHGPLGLLWLGLVTASPAGDQPASLLPRAARAPAALLGAGLLLLGGLRTLTAQAKPGIEQAYLARRQPVETHARARQLWMRYPFDADAFDLRSKSAVQAAMAAPEPAAIQELDDLLRLDPHDHHLLLARAQLAKARGETRLAQDLMARYSQVAPRDPARFLRLAAGALDQGRPQVALALIAEAQRQPGFSPLHQQQADLLRQRLQPQTGSHTVN